MEGLRPKEIKEKHLKRVLVTDCVGHECISNNVSTTVGGSHALKTRSGVHFSDELGFNLLFGSERVSESVQRKLGGVVKSLSLTIYCQNYFVHTEKNVLLNEHNFIMSSGYTK